ncbi:MAG: sigma-70 family RNA polymerase sigma factor [Clostridiales bacterium]|nr:sigma-70 family RNA polymerase sigma factor [Clostridiales bacterium]
MTDEDLVLLLQQGDQGAFRELYERYKTQTLRTAYLITSNRILSDDIVQETFLKCFTQIKGLRNPKVFRSWLYKILVRTAWDMNKKQKALLPSEEFMDALLESYHGTVDPAEEDDYEQLYQAINSLHIKQRTAIILYYFNGLSVKEIAQATQSLEATVKSQLFLARKYLKKALSEVEGKGGVADARQRI